jgi:transglutaminase-like putative cysteine protease
MEAGIAEFLRPTTMVDADHPDVLAFARDVTRRVTDPVTRARVLYLAVRDGFRYDPYQVDLSVDGLKASRVLADGYGWCVPKSALLAAVCRAAGIPARVGYADVRNHLSTARLRESMGTDVFYWHGYTSIHLDGKWLKATPAFNIELCRKLGLRSLEFDGTADSIYHPYDLAGQRHMEYLHLHGEFADIPRDEILATFDRHYSGLLKLSKASFDADVEQEG